MKHWKKWVIGAGILVPLVALGIWLWPGISLYIALKQQPQIDTTRLQQLWDEYQVSFPPPPSPGQNRFLIISKIAEEFGTIVDGWKQDTASNDIWSNAMYPLIPQLPSASGLQTSPKFVAEETLLSQAQPLLDRYLSSASLPNTFPSPPTLGNPVDSSRDFNLLELSNLVLLKCSHLFATGHDSAIWPLLNANLELASALTTHPATGLDYYVGMAIRDNSLTWLGHTLQARATVVDASTIRKTINEVQPTRATWKQVLHAELANAISTAPDILNPARDSNSGHQIERQIIFANALNLLDHPDIPCKAEPADMIGTCKSRDRFQKHTKEDDTVIAGFLQVLDLLDKHQQTGQWPSALEESSTQTFQYSRDGDGFILKTREEEPRIISAPLPTY